MVMWTNTQCFDFFSCNLMYIMSICAKLQTSSASPSLLINFLKSLPPPPPGYLYIIIDHTQCPSTQYKNK